MSYCEQCAALQRQNDFLANDRDGYVQLLTNENNKLRSEIEKLRAALEEINVGEGWAALIARAAITQETRDD